MLPRGGMHDPFVARQMADRMLPLAIHAELIPRTGRRLPTPRAFVTHVAPQSRGLGLSSFPLGLHFDGGIVSKEGWSGPHQLADVFGQGFQKGRGTAPGASPVQG